MIGIDDLFASVGHTPIQHIKTFAGRHNGLREFSVGSVQLDRRISSNQAHAAIEAGLNGSVIVRGEKPNTYRINR